MNSSRTTAPASTVAFPQSWRAQVAAYWALTKPGLTGMSVGTAVAGALLAPEGWQHIDRILAIVLGTILVGGGSVALNQYAEREYDALMQRTKRRPLPSSLLRPGQGLLFGLILVLGGLLVLATLTTAVATALAGITIAVYVLVYTPLKRKTHLATAVGGIPGALPPAIGWTAITGTISIEAYALFLVMFLWQMPHFLALGWIYRQDYIRGGYRLLTAVDPTGNVTSRIILVFLWALLPASVLPFFLGMSGVTFLMGAVLAWIFYVVPGYGFLRNSTEKKARVLFVSSLLYLPLFFGLFALDYLAGLL